MTRKILLILLALSGLALKSLAQTTYSGDTIFVQAFTYNTSRDSMIVFPSDSIRMEKILMRYRLRCPYNVQCGEWDYLTYTYLYQPTGKWDSVKHVVPTYTVNGTSPDSLAIISNPTYTYTTHFDYSINYSSTISFDSTITGNGSSSVTHPFNTSITTGRSQYLWTAAELNAAGLNAGAVSGLQFNFNSVAGNLKNVVIRMKATVLDSITNSSFEQTGFTEVFRHDVTISNTGWNAFHFTNPFNWDGISNVIVDICFTNNDDGADFQVAADSFSIPVGITSMANDRSLYFFGKDYIDVPAGGFSNLDSTVTISFWQYGNPSIQPQDGSLLEAVDSSNNRVINIHLPWGNGSVYFDVISYAKKHDYGKLSGRVIDELIAGAGNERRELEGQEEKKKPC